MLYNLVNVLLVCKMSLYEYMNEHKLSSLSFDDWPDEKVKDYLIGLNNMLAFRRLEDNSVVDVALLMTTISICTGVEPLSPFKYRWCFRDAEEAKYFYQNVKEFDEIPSLEHRKSLVGHRYHQETGPLLKEYDQLGIPRW